MSALPPGFAVDSASDLLLWKNYLEQLKGPQFEKNIPYMYVDTTGNVTVGVGHNLTAKGDQLTLPFKVKRLARKGVVTGSKDPQKSHDYGIPILDSNLTLNRPATAEEIKDDFQFLTNHTALGKYSAGADNKDLMRLQTTVELDPSDVDTLFHKDALAAITKAQDIFGSDFDSYPRGCRAGIIDIIFNTGGLDNFPKLKQAIKGAGPYAGKLESERWDAAAKESNRPQVNPERNNTVKQWFYEGVAEAKAREAASTP